MPQGPTPDFDRVLLRWYGVNMDGTPCTGTLELTYNGGPLLDDDPTTPIGIYAVPIRRTIGTTKITVGAQQQTVGFAEFEVPASDDPDILGSGGTYRLVENLTNGRGRTIDFEVSKDAPNGVVFLNRLTTQDPIPGQPVPSVTRQEFTALVSRVDTIVGGPGTGVPEISDISGLQPALDGKSDQGHGHVAADISNFTEAAQDAVAALLVGASGVTLSYNDAANSLTITGGGSGGTVDAEQVRDLIGIALVATAPLQILVNDAADTITFALSQGATGAQLLAAASPAAARTILGVTAPEASTTPVIYVYRADTGWPTPKSTDVVPRQFYSGGFPDAPSPASVPAIVALLNPQDYWDKGRKVVA